MSYAEFAQCGKGFRKTMKKYFFAFMMAVRCQNSCRHEFILQIVVTIPVKILNAYTLLLVDVSKSAG